MVFVIDFYDHPTYSLHRLQKEQNSVAHILVHVPPVLHILHQFSSLYIGQLLITELALTMLHNSACTFSRGTSLFKLFA